MTEAELEAWKAELEEFGKARIPNSVYEESIIEWAERLKDDDDSV